MKIKVKLIGLLIALISVSTLIVGCQPHNYELKGKVASIEYLYDNNRVTLTLLGGAQETFWSSSLLDEIKIGEIYLIEYHNNNPALVSTIDSIEVIE